MAEKSKKQDTKINENLAPEELKLFFESLPEEKKEEFSKVFQAISIKQSSSSFSGPIPPPNILKDYNEIVPHGAERIISMAEKQQNHRIEIEKFVIKEQVEQTKRGQFFGFSIAIFSLSLVGFLIYAGHEIVATLFGGTTILALVSVFVIGKKTQENQSQKNNNQ